MLRFSPIALLFLVACTSLLGSSPEGVRIAVATDQPAYAREPSSGGAQVSFVVRSRGTETAHVSGCPEPIGVRVERRTDTGWVDHLSVRLLCLGIYTFVDLPLAPGEQATSSVEIREPGQYRLRVPFGASADDAFSRSAVSDAFTIQ